MLDAIRRLMAEGALRATTIQQLKRRSTAISSTHAHAHSIANIDTNVLDELVRYGR